VIGKKGKKSVEGERVEPAAEEKAEPTREERVGVNKGKGLSTTTPI